MTVIITAPTPNVMFIEKECRWKQNNLLMYDQNLAGNIHIFVKSVRHIIQWHLLTLQHIVQTRSGSVKIGKNHFYCSPLRTQNVGSKMSPHKSSEHHKHVDRKSRSPQYFKDRLDRKDHNVHKTFSDYYRDKYGGYSSSRERRRTSKGRSPPRDEQLRSERYICFVLLCIGASGFEDFSS